MKTLVLKIEYDGTNYSGWQIQPNAPTVQQSIQEAILRFCDFDVSLMASGRTDAGVHARGQVIHTLMQKDGNDFELMMPDEKFAYILNTHLPNDIKILKAKTTEKPFHARFDAIAREYSYTLTNVKSAFNARFQGFMKYHIDFDLLKQAEKIFIGQHNFTTFSKHNPSTLNNVCNVYICNWELVESNVWKLQIKSTRFLYGMVRAIVGAMIDVARSKRSLEEIVDALHKQDRSLASPLAPAKGLFFENAFYPEGLIEL